MRKLRHIACLALLAVFYTHDRALLTTVFACPLLCSQTCDPNSSGCSEDECWATCTTTTTCGQAGMCGGGGCTPNWVDTLTEVGHIEYWGGDGAGHLNCTWYTMYHRNRHDTNGCQTDIDTCALGAPQHAEENIPYVGYCCDLYGCDGYCGWPLE